MSVHRFPPTLPDEARFVRLNSVVDVEEINGGERKTVRVVPPSDADERAGRVSTFAPLGRALLGARIGTFVDVPSTDGGGTCVQVLAVRAGSDDA